MTVAKFIFPLTDIYLSLNGEVIPNHGYVEISDIGSSDSTALLCHTNRPASGGANSGGNWLAPDGTRVGVPGSTDVPGLHRNKGPMVVRLKRSNSGSVVQGIYHCIVADSKERYQRVYFGLYNTGEGKIPYKIFLLCLTYQFCCFYFRSDYAFNL